uniref:Uncharacterized protein n=1 Tax=Chromera velia CCMP2878 TaxID=1169474 RepID=A0A0G4H918_9ALVE|eukprot:Cvel_5954.t1-p1 / transcript=Cvel_5954.t1 / gene=Cvel_5954 / organism=Chromera_velia_CCMP2878 / gene_product=hypothetical protein / transcript_product=hypothetical protein / location=Cvel_scaffold284:98341-99111(-) / protein_length=207 / sequence_SO=supercontig / SO=protein_coding / is_pseudo=false
MQTISTEKDEGGMSEGSDDSEVGGGVDPFLYKVPGQECDHGKVKIVTVYDFTLLCQRNLGSEEAVGAFLLLLKGTVFASVRQHAYLEGGRSSRRRGSDFLTDFEREFKNAQRELESVPEADVTTMAPAPGMVSQMGRGCGGAMGGMALTEGGWRHVFSSHAPHMRAVGTAVGEDHAGAPQQQVGDRQMVRGVRSQDSHSMYPEFPTV